MLESLTDDHAGRALLVCVRAVIRLLHSKVSDHPAVRASATPAVAFDSLPHCPRLEHCLDVAALGVLALLKARA